MATFTIGLSTTNFNGSTHGVQPGDTIRVAAGNRGPLTITNVLGADGNPVTITNYDGQCVLSGGWATLQFQNCRYVHVDGTGHGDVQYGFDVSGSTNCCVFAYKMSTNIEINNVYMHDTDGAGLRIYTKIDEADEGFTTVEDCSVHDCYIAWTRGGCSMYLGNDSDKNLPGDGLEVYDNTLYMSTTDGIQIKQWSNVSIHDNDARSIGYDAATKTDQACAAYLFVSGSGSVYDNFSHNCERGIEFDNPTGTCYAYRNVVSRSGYYRGGHGVTQYTSVAHIYHNTVVDSHRDGIRLHSYGGATSCYDNFVVKWGDGYVAVREGTANCYNNESVAVIEDAKFVDADGLDFHLEADSPAIGQAHDGSDCGAYQYEAPGPEPPTVAVTVTTTVTATIPAGA